MRRRVSFHKGGIYHVFNRGNRKKDIFYTERDYERFLEMVRYYAEVCGFLVSCYCLLPNHYHLAMSQVGDATLPIMMQRLGLAYTKYFNVKYRKVGHVFQGRYQVTEVLSRLQWERLVRYIENNPVEFGLVEDVVYYRWIKIDTRYPSLWDENSEDEL